MSKRTKAAKPEPEKTSYKVKNIVNGANYINNLMKDYEEVEIKFTDFAIGGLDLAAVRKAILSNAEAKKALGPVLSFYVSNGAKFNKIMSLNLFSSDMTKALRGAVGAINKALGTVSTELVDTSDSASAGKKSLNLSQLTRCFPLETFYAANAVSKYNLEIQGIKIPRGWCWNGSYFYLPSRYFNEKSDVYPIIRQIYIEIVMKIKKDGDEDYYESQWQNAVGNIKMRGELNRSVYEKISDIVDLESTLTEIVSTYGNEDDDEGESPQ